MNLKNFQRSLWIAFSAILLFPLSGLSVDMVIKKGSPTDHTVVPDIQSLQRSLQTMQNLASQGRLNQTAILDFNTHDASVLGANSFVAPASGSSWITTGPNGLHLQQVGLSTNISWPAVSGNGVLYKVYCNGNLMITTSYNSAGTGSLTPGQTYTYSVQAVDLTGTVLYTDSVTITAKTPAPPLAPIALNVQEIGPSSVQLTWRTAEMNPGVQYWIYRNGTFIGKALNSQFTDTTALAGSPNNYTVVAVDLLGQRSNPTSASIVLPSNVPTAPSPVLIFDEGSVHISVYDAQDPAYKLSPAELAKIQELLSLLPASHLQNIKTIQINPAPMQYGIVQGSATYAGDTLTIGAGPTANRANDPLNIPYELLDGIGQAVYDHVLIDYVRQNMVGSFNDSPRSAFANSYALYVTNTLQTFSQAWGAFQNHAYGFSLGQVMYDLWRATIVATLFTGPYATALMDQSTSFFVPSSGGPLGSTTVRDQPFFQHPGQYIQIGRYRLIEGTDPNMGGLAIVSIEDMTTQQIIVLIQPQAIPEMVGETVPINYDYRPLNYNYL